MTNVSIINEVRLRKIVQLTLTVKESKFDHLSFGSFNTRKGNPRPSSSKQQISTLHCTFSDILIFVL